MAHNVENPASISYVSLVSDPDRVNEVIEEEEREITQYCNRLEIVVLVCEALTAASLALCAFLI